MIANTPQPPYYAVVFTSLRTDENKGYPEMSEKMLLLAREQEGFLGAESTRDKLGITVSYWKNMEAIRKWRENVEYLAAQKLGKQEWYKSYKVRVAKVERDYGFER